MKQPKKLTSAKLKIKIWEHCKRIIRARYGNKCYTCGRHCEGSNQHTGHMIAKGSLPLKFKFDLNLLRIQCYACNVHHGGQGAYFVKRWESEGNNFEELERQIKQTPTMGSIESWVFLTELLTEYEKI